MRVHIYAHFINQPKYFDLTIYHKSLHCIVLLNADRHHKNDHFVMKQNIISSEKKYRDKDDLVVVCMHAQPLSKVAKVDSWVPRLTFSWVTEFPNCHEERFFHAQSVCLVYKSQGPIMQRLTLSILHITH